MSTELTVEEKLDALHKEAYDKARDDLFKRQLSNNEHFDKGILTLASAGLALTITFMAGLKAVHYVPWLGLCWFTFVAAIVLTIISYLVSQKAINVQLILLKNYHVDRDESAMDAGNRYADFNEYLAYGSAGCFVAGVISMLLFFGSNAWDGNFANNKTATSPAITTPQAQVSVTATHVQISAPSAITSPVVATPATALPGSTSQPQGKP